MEVENRELCEHHTLRKHETTKHGEPRISYTKILTFDILFWSQLFNVK